MATIVNVVCYSYKGGSGRSTAAVNIAFSLASRGKKVICLDLDVGAPGLHLIMSQWSDDCEAHLSRNEDGRGIQSFLNEPVVPSLSELSACMFDVGLSENDKYVIGPGGGLVFVFSSTRDRTLTDLTGQRAQVDSFVSKYQALQQKLAVEHLKAALREEVYVIVDAPNGITPVSLPLLRSADLILMFYRHSLQHVLGTIETAEKIRRYLGPQIESRFLRLLLVGSCVPLDWIRAFEDAATKSAGLGWGKEATTMHKRFSEIRRKLDELCDGDWAITKLEGVIVEDPILKVLEQPLTGEGIPKTFLDPLAKEGEKFSDLTKQKIRMIVDELMEYGEAVKRRKSPV